MNLIRRRTTCQVPGHGTRCEPAQEKDTRHSRGTEERLALEFELHADADDDGEASRETATAAVPKTVGGNP